MRDVYMINVVEASGSVFVKTLDLFRNQGGFREDWGRHWYPVVATGIDDARCIGCTFPHARPYERQAW